jgi:hypothetical protein
MSAAFSPFIPAKVGTQNELPRIPPLGSRFRGNERRE